MYIFLNLMLLRRSFENENNLVINTIELSNFSYFNLSLISIQKISFALIIEWD